MLDGLIALKFLTGILSRTCFGIVLVRVDSCRTRVDSCQTRVDSCQTRVDSCQTRVDSCQTRVDSCGLVLTCVGTRVLEQT